MKWFLGVYTKRFNLRHKWCGHLFAGRYKAWLVDGGGSGYLRTACNYVHLNPVRKGVSPGYCIIHCGSSCTIGKSLDVAWRRRVQCPGGRSKDG